MGYQCLGNGDFLINLLLYRDCTGPQIPDSLAISIYDAGNNLVAVIQAPKLYQAGLDIPNYGNPCLAPPGDLCMEEALYGKLVNLPGSAGGYVIVSQACCRSARITNIHNPQSIGATYWARMPDPSMGCNSAPFFGNVPPLAICNVDTLKYDHSAFDMDGDSLVYYLCEAVTGGSLGDLYPDTPPAPPYPSAPYASGYSALSPLGVAGTASIDSQTGHLTLYPTQVGTFLVTICVDEYRNGQKIGEYRREVQFAVVSCTVNVSAGILGNAGVGTPIYSCGSTTVNFQNASTGAPLFWWDFGTGDPADTSIAWHPTFTYPDTGTYTVTLIANKPFICADTAYATVVISDNNATVQAVGDTTVCSGTNAQLSAVGTGSFQWVPSSSVSNSKVANPMAHPAVSTTYTVTLTDSLNCIAHDSVTVTVFPTTPVSFTGLEATHYVTDDTDTLTGSPTGGFFSGNGIVGSTFDPTLAGVGLHQVIYTWIDTNGCANSSAQWVYVYCNLTVTVEGLEHSYLDNDPPDTLIGTPPGGTFTGNGIVGDVFDPALAGVGTHTIYYTFTDSFGCTEVDSMTTEVSEPIGLNDPAKSSQFTIVPNPSNGRFELIIHDGVMQTLTVQITDLHGRVVEHRELEDGAPTKVTFDLSWANAGVYFIEVSAERGSGWRTPLVITH